MRPLRFLPTILLLFLPGSPSPPAVKDSFLSGLVTDGNRPLPGATVRFPGFADSTQTDAQGRFQLAWPRRTAERIVASKPGYWIAGMDAAASPLVLALRPLPKEDCERYEWVDPRPDPRGRHNCGNCHEEIHNEWSAGAHARSAINPRLRNLLDGTDAKGRPGIGWNLRADNPDGVGVCNSCHAPTADPFQDLHRVEGVAARGVHCDYCHKIAGPESGKIGWAHGRYGLKLLRPTQGQLFFGPLDDVDRGEDSFSAFYRDSRYCASCHEGTVFGTHVYGTYSEWQQSPARAEGKQCQTCHMAPTGRMSNLAPGKGGIPRDPRRLASHRLFPGGQAAMLRACLKVSATWTRRPEGIRVAIEVRADGVGHRVPTGFVDRNLVLVVEAGTRLVSGPLLPAAAGPEFDGRPGRLYAKLLQNPNGQSPAPFWRPDLTATDTRLIPGQTDRSTFQFEPATKRIRWRLFYRRFWPEVARAKGWSDESILLIDQTREVLP